jgi:nitrogen fixation/metabolism regulation signal transduction histidine kinase
MLARQRPQARHSRDKRSRLANAQSAVVMPRQPGAIRVEVQDSGMGLQEPDKIFEAFFTTKQNGMGMGATRLPFDHRIEW